MKELELLSGLHVTPAHSHEGFGFTRQVIITWLAEMPEPRTHLLFKLLELNFERIMRLVFSSRLQTIVITLL